jgi:hypothetical protein
LNRMSDSDMLLQAVQAMDGMYNREIRMLATPFKSPGYHTTLRQVEIVHPTRETVQYALALLDTELPEYERRAFDILETIVSLQDTNPDQATFGIWPWFYEEPLSRMSPPDWNWADFIGKNLVLAALRHGRRFPEALRQSVRQSVFCACDAIMKRNVGPHYTNIAIMGAFVTLLAGELYGRRDYERYGLNRLNGIVEFTRKLGSFQEYNSPTYTIVAVLELSKLKTETKNDQAKAWCDELLDRAWKMIADHFHAGTKQWAGPHSRSYSTMLSDRTKAFLQVATDGRLLYFPWDRLPYEGEWFKSGIRCPSSYLRCFTERMEKSLTQCYFRDESGEERKWATTFMTSDYALGTFSREIMWNQATCLLAYVRNGGGTTYMRLRALHDGYDFCSAVFTAAQYREQVLFGVSFLTNGGDTHPALDRIDGTVEASDIRLRLEIGGNLNNVNAVSAGDRAAFTLDGLNVQVATLFAAFDDGTDRERWEWEIGRKDEVCFADLVIYSGDKKTIDFRSMREAAFLFSMALGEKASRFEAVVEHDSERVRATGDLGERPPLTLILPRKPQTL